MMRQFIRRGAILSAIVAGSSGCETLHRAVRSDHDSQVTSNNDRDDPTAPKSVESDVSKVNSVNSDDKNPQPFFNKTRARSAWSSFSPGAQQIEKDLGVY